MERFQCAFCLSWYEKHHDQTEAEKKAEYEALFSQPLGTEPVVVVCHDCWLMMLTINPPPGMQHE